MFGQTIKNFHINLNARNDRATYSGGDLVSGQVSFDLTKPSAINSVTLALKGRARVAWSTGSRKHRRHHSATVAYFNFKQVIMSNGDAAIPSRFPPGKLVYPFTCQIPHGDFPSSFKGLHGQIVYSLVVEVDRPWHLNKSYETELNFVTHTYPNYELMAPLTGTNIKRLCCLCCASGPISMTVHLERKAFLPGEDVRIRCEFSNASSRAATTKAHLVQSQVVYTLSRGSSSTLSQGLASQAGDAVLPYSSDVHSELTLKLPSNLPFTISNCAIMDVSYLIEVNLCVKYSPNLKVLCPIVICDLLSYDVAPPPGVSYASSS